MNVNDSRDDVADLALMLAIPPERHLPAGRRHTIKEHLMTELRNDQPATQPEPPARRAKRVRRPRRLALTAVAAGALTAAAVTASLTGLPGHSRPAPGGNPGGHPTATHLLSMIADAAGKAKPQDVSDSQFEYIATQESYGTNDGPAPDQTHLRQIWIPVADLCGPSLLIENGKRYDVGGSSIAVSSSPEGSAGSASSAGSSAVRANPHLRDKDYVPISNQKDCPDPGGLNDPTYRFLQSLPTDPHALLDRIYTEEGRAGRSADQEAFTTIGDLLGESIAPPDVSAALYRAAALIPGVTVIPDAQDALGNPGVAVSFTSNGAQDEWIFNKDTLQLIGERGFDNGTLTGKSAIVARAFVDHNGELPPAQ
jgi:hypothetical protein